MASAAYEAEMARKRGSSPRTKIEHISKTATVTDITDHFLSGANLEQVRERAPDEIQAGQFDIVLSNEDGMFSEYIDGSLFFETDYHLSKIRISEGFLLPDGTEEYVVQGVGFIDVLVTDALKSTVTLRCRDLLWRIMDQKLHSRPLLEVPLPGGGNVGDGDMSGLAKRPFVSVNQTWTVTCTLGGGDGVATFSVVGSISGSIGPATSGAEFTSTAHGLRFTLNRGTVDWVIADVFTFSMSQCPEWVGLNAGKVIWSILTGYDWDSNTAEDFAAHVFTFDHTQSDANTELDYESFATAISAIDSIGVYDLKGYAPYDTDAVEFIQSLIVMFLGSLFTGNDGRIKLTTYIPAFTPEFVAFADSEKIAELSYSRSVDEIINYVSVNYVGSDDWPWSSDSLELNGHFVQADSDSITKYKQLPQGFDLPWYSSSGGHVQDFCSKLIAKYKDPPLNIEFRTGLDALLTQIGDRVTVTDQKNGLLEVLGEITRIEKQFDSRPSAVFLRVRQDSSTSTLFGAIGSEADEGDGLSPQSDDYTTATAGDKNYAYFSKVGDSGAPQYSMF